MKLQLNENTFNAYINEAIKQEINEGVWDKLASFASKKAAGKAAKKAASKAPRIVGHAPRTKAPFNFARNVKNAKNARLSLKDFRKGKPLEMTVQGSKNASYNGQKFWVKKVDGKVRFFSDPSCKAEYLLTTEKGGLGAAARSSWNSELSHMKNLLNSARRNAAGTLAVTGGLGAGYLLGRNGRGGQKDPNAPWNDGDDDNDGNGEDGGASWDGAFPWDDVQPRWTPKPKKTQPQPNPVTPKKPSIMDTPLEKVDTSKMNLPGQVSQLKSPGLAGNKPVQQPTMAQSAIHAMAQTTNANDNNPLQNRARQNRMIAGNMNHAINQAAQNGDITRQDARAQKQQINQARRDLNRTGQPISN